MIPTLVALSNPENDRDHVVVPLARAPVPDGSLRIGPSAVSGRTVARHWVAVSILAHLLVIGALVLGLLEARQPEPPAVLKITLIPQGPGSAGAARGRKGGGDAAGPQANQPENPAPQPEPVKPRMSAPEKPPAVLVKPDTVAPVEADVAPPAPAPVITPPPLTTARPQLAMEIPLPKPRPASPRRRAQPHRETQSRAAAPPMLQRAPPREAEIEPPRQGRTAAAPAAAGLGAGPGKGVAGAGRGAVGTTAGPGDDYLQRLYRHLLRYKRYPPEAISAKEQGAAVIGFRIARDGTISGARIEKSSGSPVLDQATLTMVARASPAPALPDSFIGQEARVRFPIDYKLSLIDQMF